MLLVVLLMSMLMLLSTRLWRSTASVVDIAIQKQLHVQKKWALRGVLACGMSVCKTDAAALIKYLEEQGDTATIQLASQNAVSPHLAHMHSQLIFALRDERTIAVTAQLIEQGNVVESLARDFTFTEIVA